MGRSVQFGQTSILLLQPLFPFEKDQAADDYSNAHHNDCQVSITPFQFRHITEIHTIPSRYERQRHKDGCNNCKQRHRLVLTNFQLRIMKVSYLNRIIAEGRFLLILIVKAIPYSRPIDFLYAPSSAFGSPCPRTAIKFMRGTVMIDG